MSPDETSDLFAILMVKGAIQTLFNPIAPLSAPVINYRLEIRPFLERDRDGSVEYGCCHRIQFRGQCTTSISCCFKGNGAATPKQIQYYRRMISGICRTSINEFSDLSDNFL